MAFSLRIPRLLGSSDTEKPKPISKRPPNTAFRQQRLKSWQPILTPQSVLPLLVLFTCIFTPIGVGLIIGTLHVQDIIIDYTKCETLANLDSFTEIPSKYVNYHFKQETSIKPGWQIQENSDGQRSCQLQFEIPNDITSSVYVFYKLTNFFQNHRRYVTSFDRNQLKGKAVKISELDESCRPLREFGDKAIYPCGLIANSMFNDTFAKSLIGVEETTDFELTNKGISWSIDRSRFKKTTYNASDIVPPPNWTKLYPDGYTDENIPDLHSWEELQVWMRTASFPNFYKLAAKNETSDLPKGQYIYNIESNYPISDYGGTKSFVLSTSSIIGGRNVSLGVVFLIVAGICIIFTFIFLIKIISQPRSMGDQTYLHFDVSTDTFENEANTPPREIL
ncbi:hypothetical protein Kpol_458p2 [Vanderwaltozyma polyspora DSM 70294]|uniref:Cell division control protein 50 n=1 Tax=Vanderwaltozyma polyspora (strain ATCC 22028 / DSM 70294 / BCRC 21397 / CBS 2163 / NBRC 10782 / NRRL Y-8283 / UCD 57-17) TaxID=436907 RepID=A7TR96_VANPO|nr:uncharacterized protein Kpol_458p2 [Vanderwaltozyma polyspora DSM 70294]EDO15209.1 hypothetical protein Kpol_458p2 [Vanderwaltozyma polyspora DSM 70294]